MPSTHVSLSYHIVFSTMHRQAFISKALASDLHAYLGGIIQKLGGVAIEIGGVADHVHILVGLKATHCLADLLREIKSGSSQWLHEQRKVRCFSWQEGYAAVTVSPSAIEQVRRYIATQEEHHRKKTFQEELVEFLQQNGIAYDERYLW